VSVLENRRPILRVPAKTLVGDEPRNGIRYKKKQMTCVLQILTALLSLITTILVIALMFCSIYVYRTVVTYRKLLETTFPSLLPCLLAASS